MQKNTLKTALDLVLAFIKTRTRKQWGITATSVLLLIVTGLGIHTYQEKEKREAHNQFNLKLESYISAYTSGEIQRRSPIIVQFADEMIGEEDVDISLEEKVFHFEPAIQGKTTWENTRTLRFEPEAELDHGKLYRAKVKLDALPEDFLFQFAVRPQELDLHISGLTTTDEQEFAWQKLQGEVETKDYESNEAIERVLSAKLGRDKVEIEWDHKKDGYIHAFSIDSIQRKDDEQEIQLTWNGKGIGINFLGKKRIKVPAIGSFSHMRTTHYSGTSPRVEIEFSDPLDPNQDIDGLVRLGNGSVGSMIEGNKIIVFPKGMLSGEKLLKVSRGIRNLHGAIIEAPIHETLDFDPIVPEVKLIGKGTIIPQSGTLPFIFESRGLRAVDVRVIKIYEKNIPQFLQINQLDGGNQLKRVGQWVAQEKIDLDKEPNLNLNNWTRHSIDLSKIINPDPGAIYEVALGFRYSYTLYECSGDSDEDKDMLAMSAKWNVPSDNGYYYDDWYGDGYYYRDRDNPCKRSFYNRNRIVKRNVLASDLGILAKRGDYESFFSVTNIKSTAPMGGVNLEAYDFQHQLIQSFQTDAQGWVKARFDQKPFLIVAKSGKQRGYLRMDDGTALSISRFDTGGKKYHKGVKGFIYGERGVWRPGDEMYLGFIMEDKDDAIPDDHPVRFELRDPKGQMVFSQVQTSGLNGVYHFMPKTDSDAITGSYTAKVEVGGAVFTKKLKVEAIIPNRLKLDLDFGVKSLSNSTRNLRADLAVTWLHGAVAPGLDTEVGVTLKQASTKFEGFERFVFDDPVRKFQTDEKTLFKGQLNEEGKAKVPAIISVNKTSPGRLNANFSVKAFEKGGGFSTEYFTLPFHPYETYVGLDAPEPDNKRWGTWSAQNEHIFDIATVDREGKPVSRSGVSVKVYRLNWRWWWDNANERLVNYEGKLNAKEVASSTISTVNGKGTYKLKLKDPEWGRYLVRIIDKEGHISGKMIYFSWGNPDPNSMPGGATMLSFSSDKDNYSVGETVNLDIPTGFEGRALVSVESGAKVLETYWINATKGSTKFSFEASSEMAPNVYVSVSLLQPHAQTKNDLPIRMYGVLPIKVENLDTKVKPVISMPSEVEPMSDYFVAVNEADGKPMTYTIAVVDEGLLNITRFATPDPWNSFYQRQALNVRTWDIFDHVLGAYSGKINSLLSIGGGAGEQAPDASKLNRFKPVVKFLGPFSLKAGEKKNHKISMPNYTGSVRTMVVATDGKGAYGSSEVSTPVKKDLMVLGTLPRVLGPGESLQLPVTIFANSDKIKDVSVSVSTSKKLMVEGLETRSVNFAQPGEKMANFSITVLNSIGTQTVTITAKSGSEVSSYKTDIEIRVPNPRVTDVFAKTTKAGENWKQGYKPVGVSGTNNGVLEVSNIPPLGLDNRLKYLIRYPYGCIEQTTSSGFPQLFLTNLVRMGPERKQATQININATIDRLKSFQRSEGGFSYWPGASTTSHWGTNYGGHFLLEAKNAGYAVPSDMLNKWVKYQQKQAAGWVNATERWHNPTLTQAYRLYLLSKAGKPNMGAMNRFRQIKDIKTVSKWQLAGAYALAGKKDIARTIINGVGTTVSDYVELGGTYGSSLRDYAMILEVLIILGEDEKAGAVAKLISGKLSDHHSWYSTQTTAYSLVAMAKYIGGGELGDNFEFEWRQKGGSWQKVKSEAPIWQEPIANADRSGEIEIRNKSKGIIFPRLILDGIPLRGDTSSASNDLRLSILYKTMKGKIINPARLPQGTDFVAEVTVNHTGVRERYEEMVIHQIFPSGWQIYNTRLSGGETGGDTPEFQDIRDDRVYTFYDIQRGKTKTFRILLNASYLGKYYLPAVSSEAMYDRTINARVPGKWVEVVEAVLGD